MSGLFCLIMYLLKSPFHAGHLPDLTGRSVPSGVRHHYTLYPLFTAHFTHTAPPPESGSTADVRLNEGRELLGFAVVSAISGLLKCHPVNERGECLQGARFFSYVKKPP